MFVLRKLFPFFYGDRARYPFKLRDKPLVTFPIAVAVLRKMKTQSNSITIPESQTANQDQHERKTDKHPQMPSAEICGFCGKHFPSLQTRRTNGKYSYFCASV